MTQGARTFADVWATLNLEGAELAFGATITPDGYARLTRATSATVPLERQRAAAGISVATLPHLSIDLRGPAHRTLPSAADDGDIVVTGVLGEGGMGRVLLARQRSLARDVAVKTLRDEAAGPAQADALVSEGLITGHLEHPNITPVHQLGTDKARRPLLVMKRIAGVSWQDLIDDPRHPAWEKIPTLPSDRLRAHLEILMQVCNGISFAHSRSVVHRDIKPENVMIGEFGEVYVCDWGIGVKIPLDPNAPRGLVGTPCYLAPEMLDYESSVGPETDVYLLGGTLHTVLTGRPRHEGATVKEVLEAAFESVVFNYPADVPAELADLANRATARARSARPASALAFRAALASYLSHEASVGLARAATERLDQLEAHRARGSADATVVARALTESRFGFTQALRDWPENQVAREGLERCLESAVELEIAGENVAGARALLAEMSSKRPDLDARVEELAKRLEERAADAVRLEHMRHEADLSISSGVRRLLLLGLVAVGIGMHFVLRSAQPIPLGEERGFVALVPPNLAIFTMASLGVFVARKRLLVTTANRQFIAVMLGGMALELLHRVECYLSHEMVSTAMRGDCLILAAAVGVASFFVSRTFLLAAAVLVVASLLSIVVPSILLLSYVVSHLGVLVILAYGWKSAA